MAKISEHRIVQSIAKAVLSELARTIRSNDSERTIAKRAVELLSAHGITQTWYYDCPALVLLGTRSCLSISGRQYAPADQAVGEANLVTVDLSPCLGGVWGDCARSFFVEEGRCVDAPKMVEFQEGAAMVARLHDGMRAFVTSQTTCDELFEFANATIRSHGFENLDFLGNVGHSIEAQLEDRRYIEAGNTQRLSDLGLFTFEPHLRKAGGCWGFKHENIYFINADGRVEEL